MNDFPDHALPFLLIRRDTIQLIPIFSTCSRKGEGKTFCGKRAASVTVGCRPDGLSSLPPPLCSGVASPLAKHIVQGTGCGQGNTDLYGLVRTCTDPPSPEASEGKQHRALCGLCRRENKSTGLCGCGTAGKGKKHGACPAVAQRRRERGNHAANQLQNRISALYYMFYKITRTGCRYVFPNS